MERLNVMSGILAFSFPCLIGAGIASPGGIKAEVLSKQDSLIYFGQTIENQVYIDSCDVNFDIILISQPSPIK